MGTMTRITLLLVALTALFASLGCGKPLAPDVSLYPLDGGPRKKLSDFRGKVVLIDMWATWCGPCRETMPIVERMHNQYGDKGLEIAAVSPETAPVVNAYLKENPVHYPVYLDIDETVFRGFENKQLPDCVLIGRDGSVVFRGHPGDVAALEQAIQAALG